MAEAYAWLQRAQVRIGDEPQPRAEYQRSLDISERLGDQASINCRIEQ